MPLPALSKLNSAQSSVAPVILHGQQLLLAQQTLDTLQAELSSFRSLETFLQNLIATKEERLFNSLDPKERKGLEDSIQEVHDGKHNIGPTTTIDGLEPWARFNYMGLRQLQTKIRQHEQSITALLPRLPSNDELQRASESVAQLHLTLNEKRDEILALEDSTLELILSLAEMIDTSIEEYDTARMEATQLEEQMQGVRDKYVLDGNKLNHPGQRLSSPNSFFNPHESGLTYQEFLITQDNSPYKKSLIIHRIETLLAQVRELKAKN